MDDLGKRPDFKLSVQGSTFRNYGTPSKYMSVNRLPKHTDSPSLLQIDHKSGIYPMLKLDKTDKLCFMNSILQCLSNTAPLTEYCLEDRYLKDINKSSSMNGMLFRSYADLMKEIWDPDMANSSTSPSRFKSQIQRFAPRFMGYSQQDSQEFLRYVLEGLHMEVNRVQKRPIPTKPDYEAEDRLP
ncbi:Ubiquitin carboxyl-terminal hydrolase 2 [Schistosoma japonicum]|nr:Ubiquitin carboxyl-terminal hydrolase 2 [Schistosoma japonicum]KAH8849368.1 Ubiquitin carboxyl-terminal hydrolase 2 [Schistosoma japonicum]